MSYVRVRWSHRDEGHEATKRKRKGKGKGKGNSWWSPLGGNVQVAAEEGDQAANVDSPRLLLHGDKGLLRFQAAFTPDAGEQTHTGAGPTDEVLAKSIPNALSLCNPHGQQISQAKALSRDGQQGEAAPCTARRCRQGYLIGFGWEL